MNTTATAPKLRWKNVHGLRMTSVPGKGCYSVSVSFCRNSRVAETTGEARWLGAASTIQRENGARIIELFSGATVQEGQVAGEAAAALVQAKLRSAT